MSSTIHTHTSSSNQREEREKTVLHEVCGELREQRRLFAALLEVSKGGNLTQEARWSQEGVRELVQGRGRRQTAPSPAMVWWADASGSKSPSGMSQHEASEVAS